MLKKNLFTLTLAMLLCSASQLFSQGKWVPSTWPPDSLNIEQRVIKSPINELFQAAVVLGQSINSAPTTGQRTVMTSGEDTLWWKTILADNDVLFEAGGNISHHEPFWFSIITNGVKVQWTPENRFGEVWTNWGSRGNEPNWAFVLNGYEMTWEAEETGEGNFTQADLIRVQNAIATIQACVPPYQSMTAGFYNHQDSVIRAAIARADAIPDPEEELPVLNADLDKLFSINITFDTIKVFHDTIIDGWRILRLAKPQGMINWMWQFTKNDSSYCFNEKLQCVTARRGFTYFYQSMEPVKISEQLTGFVVLNNMLPDAENIPCLETPPVDVRRTGWVKD